MGPPNADILELKEMVRDLFSIVQGLALGQKAMAERLERIEGWMIKEKVQEKALSSEVTNPSGSAGKKSLDNGQPKKKVESSGAQTKRECSKDRYHSYAATVTIPVGDSSAPQRQQSPQQRTQRAVGQPRVMVPMRTDQRPPNYDENAQCEFHSGTPGHNIEGGRAFKNVVQDLVDSQAISFAPSPNVNANPMPAHGQVMRGAIAEDLDHAYTVGGETNSDWEIDQWTRSCVPGSWKA
ncbi:hypothetical protein KIW84_010231 [Lathyrus oleraceus]|uniref:Uncharacterized protein n=1 Tax=Pisum sativum TaxID=3888 RepID=A0A9D4YNN1_PEA|nr:hypothetical protein KIW84_010231 [Pisum sativum]